MSSALFILQWTGPSGLPRLKRGLNTARKKPICCRETKRIPSTYIYHFVFSVFDNTFSYAPPAQTSREWQGKIIQSLSRLEDSARSAGMERLSCVELFLSVGRCIRRILRLSLIGGTNYILCFLICSFSPYVFICLKTARTTPTLGWLPVHPWGILPPKVRRAASGALCVARACALYVLRYLEQPNQIVPRIKTWLWWKFAAAAVNHTNPPY